MPSEEIITKVVDSKGRLNLGREYIGKTVIVRKISEGLQIEKAAVIPERELWLYQNPKALAAVLEGIEQAKNGEFAENPPVIDLSVLDEVDEG